MDGVGGMPRIQREHLGCPARRRQQDHLLLQSRHGPDDRTCQRRLTRTSRTAHDHHHILHAVCQEEREHVERMLLLRRWREA